MSGMKSVGLIGCGHIAGAHLEAFKQTKHSTVTGVFDVSRELAEKRAKEFGVERIYNTLEEAIAASDVVDVCTPPHTHADIACKILEARKHLLIEKPLVTSLSDWERIQAVKKPESAICVVHNLKFTHAIQQAKEWVDEGRIGDVIRIHRLFLTNPEDDRMLVDPEPGKKPHWSHALPGGRWFETLPHELYITHMFAGPLELDAVTALQTKASIGGAPADEVCIVFAGARAISTVHYSASCAENRRSVEIYGTHGKIDVDILSDSASISQARDGKWKRAVGLKNIEGGHRLVQAVGDRLEYAKRRVLKETPHATIIAAFDRHLVGEGPTPTPLEEIDYVVKNCDRVGREIDRAVARARGARSA
jgi:predicted dehydrogenase